MTGKMARKGFAILAVALFVGALFVPPTASRFMLRSAPVWERLGEMWFRTFAGVVVVEATKQIYAAKPMVERLKQRRRVLLPMPGTPSPAGP